MNYYTADLHFGCQSIFEREKRGEIFKDLEQMNKTLVENINEACQPDDVLYILGDVSCAEYNPAKELSAIKCKKILIAGNHDRKWLEHKSFKRQFVKIFDTGYVRTLGTRITLSHFPIAEWDGFFKGHWHFYGHVHRTNMGSGRMMEKIPNCYNVGVDVNDYKPVTAAQAIAKKLLNDYVDNVDYSFYKEIFGDVVGGSVNLVEEDASGKSVMDILGDYMDEYGKNIYIDEEKKVYYCFTRRGTKVESECWDWCAMNREIKQYQEEDNLSPKEADERFWNDVKEYDPHTFSYAIKEGTFEEALGNGYLDELRDDYLTALGYRFPTAV